MFFSALCVIIGIIIFYTPTTPITYLLAHICVLGGAIAGACCEMTQRDKNKELTRKLEDLTIQLSDLRKEMSDIKKRKKGLGVVLC